MSTIAQQPPDSTRQPERGPQWTEEQFNWVTYAYTGKRPLLCPNCQATLLTKESPGPKPNTIVVAFFCPQCLVGARAGFMRIDPNIFIHPPYVKCPECGQDEFGVLSINGNGYSRRCRNRECRHDGHIYLGRPHKKVVYLDQHIISDMVKAIHPTTDPKRRERAVYARRVFEVLDRAIKLQLVICPDSPIHLRESMVTPGFKDLERMYEHLSSKVSYCELWDIAIAQVVAHARHWLNGTPIPMLDAQDVVSGDLHGWHDHFLIGADYVPETETVHQVRARRDYTAAHLTGHYRHWASMPGTTFARCRSEMIASFGVGVAFGHRDYFERRNKSQGPEEEPPLSVELMRAVAAAFAAAGLSREDAAYNTALYFKNADHGTLPFLHLDALLTAALVWQFATGRSNTLNKGTTNDLAAIKYFLPYCDAMYVDNAMRALLADHQVARELRFGARVFSRKTCDEFVAYLEELIVSAPVEHIAKIREVYGEKRGEPFTSMYEPRRKETS